MLARVTACYHMLWPVVAWHGVLSRVMACYHVSLQGKAAAGAALRGEGDGRLLLGAAVPRRGERCPFKSRRDPHRDPHGDPKGPQ